MNPTKDHLQNWDAYCNWILSYWFIASRPFYSVGCDGTCILRLFWLSSDLIFCRILKVWKPRRIESCGGQSSSIGTFCYVGCGAFTCFQKYLRWTQHVWWNGYVLLHILFQTTIIVQKIISKPVSLSQGCLSSKVFATYYTIIILVMTLRIGVSESISLISILISRRIVKYENF